MCWWLERRCLRGAVAPPLAPELRCSLATQHRNQCEDTDWIGLCWTILVAAIGTLGRDKVLMVRVEHQFPGRLLVFHSLISQL